MKDSTGEGEIFNEFIAEALSRGKGLAEPFGALVRGTDPASITYLPARDKLPFRHVGDRRGKSKSEGDVAGLDLPVVFLGDANHAVSPFAGNGANLALKDGWDLAECLLQQPCRGGADAGRLSLEDSIRSYDARAYPRAVKTLEASRWRIKMAHSTGLRLLLFKVGLGIGGLILQALSKFM